MWQAIRGMLVYSIPKMIKVVLGVAVGVAAYLIFKNVFDYLYNSFNGKILHSVDMIKGRVGTSASQVSWSWAEWVSFLNWVLPLRECMQIFTLYCPAFITIHFCKVLFRFLDTFLLGISIVDKK